MKEKEVLNIRFVFDVIERIDGRVNNNKDNKRLSDLILQEKDKFFLVEGVCSSSMIYKVGVEKGHYDDYINIFNLYDSNEKVERCYLNLLKKIMEAPNEVLLMGAIVCIIPVLCKFIRDHEEEEK